MLLKGFSGVLEHSDFVSLTEDSGYSIPSKRDSIGGYARPDVFEVLILSRARATLKHSGQVPVD